VTHDQFGHRHRGWDELLMEAIEVVTNTFEGPHQRNRQCRQAQWGGSLGHSDVLPGRT
jgi:hypothetical protein